MGSKNGDRKPKIPWNKGKRGAEVGAGGPDSPWKDNGGPDNNQGRRPGDLDKRTVERGFRLDEVAKVAQECGDPKLVFQKLYLAAVGGPPDANGKLGEPDVKAAQVWLAYAFGRPRQIVELDGPALGLTADASGFRCFLSDGRPLPAAALPVPGGAAPRR